MRVILEVAANDELEAPPVRCRRMLSIIENLRKKFKWLYHPAEGAKKGKMWIPICQTGCTIGSEVRFAFHRPLLEAILLIASRGLRWHKAFTWIIPGSNRTHQIRPVSSQLTIEELWKWRMIGRIVSWSCISHGSHCLSGFRWQNQWVGRLLNRDWHCLGLTRTRGWM